MELIIPWSGSPRNRQRDPVELLSEYLTSVHEDETKLAGRSLPGGPVMSVTFPVDKLPARSLYAIQAVPWIGLTMEPPYFLYDAA